MNWNSIRNTWPDHEGLYLVRDCRHDVETECWYNGYEWNEPDYEKQKLNGSLLLRHYTITHWKEL